MLFCEDCQKSNDWPTSLSRSSGSCEVCRKKALCYDIPSGALPSVKWSVYDTETDKLVREGDMPAETAARIKHFLLHPETGIKYNRPKRKNSETD